MSPETTAAGVVAENCPPTPPQQSTAMFQGLCPPVAMNNNTTAANVAVTSPMSVHPTVPVSSPLSREASPRSSTSTSSMTGSNTTSTAGRKRRSMHEDEDVDDDEQRKKLLERNRLAASKCRQKKKQWVQDLENKSEQVTKKNQELHNQLAILREQCLELRNELLAHGNCGCSLVQTYLHRSSAELTCSNNTNNRHEPATAAATTVADMVRKQHPLPSTTTA